MSSIRTAGVFEFRNAGPLTTTWTAPSSCPSVEPLIRGVPWPEIPGVMAIGLGVCSNDDWRPECMPRGEEILSRQEKTSEVDLFATLQINNFYSPGLACPSAWETVGVVSTRDGSIDASGVFSSTVFQYYADETTALPSSQFALNALTSVLEPAETAIACCPSGFTANPQYGCYSSIDLSEITGKTACVYQDAGNFNAARTTDIFEYHGVTITNDRMVLVSPTSESFSGGRQTRTFTLDASGSPDITGVFPPLPTQPREGMAWTPFLHLVRGGKENDSKNIGDGKSREGEEPQGSDSEDDESGARSPLASSATLVGVVAAAWAVGFAGVCSL